MLAMPDARDASTESAGAHLGASALAAFVDGTLVGEARQAVMRHLAACRECREELVLVHALVRGAPTRQSRRKWGGVATLMVAAAVAFTMIPRAGDRADAVALTLRADSAAVVDDLPAVQLAAPMIDAHVAPEALPLGWRPVATGATYLVTLQDTTGTLIWSAVTGDTSIVVPSGGPLESGASYYWSVDAQLADGRTTRSGLRRVMVR